MFDFRFPPFLAIGVVVLFGGLVVPAVRFWAGDAVQSAPSVILTPDLDSEKLLYDDVFMDEALQRYSLRSLTASLSRLGYAKGIDCHSRAHHLGRRAYELFGGESFKDCGIECHSGCRHGATEAFFAANGTADLVGSVGVLCGDELGNRFHTHQCVHGVGHGLMAWFDYALYDALEACDTIEHSFHQGSCYSGVFMENIVGSIVGEESGTHHTDYLNDDPHYPCSAVDEKYRGQCYWLQTDRMLTLVGVDNIGTECAKAPDQFKFSCFHSMGRTVSGLFTLDPVKSFERCATIPDDSNRGWCLEGALANLFWDETHADGAVRLCELSQDSSFEGRCYDQMILRASEVVPDDRISLFCEKLPETYHQQCIAQETPTADPLVVRKSTGTADSTIPKAVVATIQYADGEYVPDVVHISVGGRVVWVNEDAERSFWPASNIHPTHAAYPGSSIKKCGTDAGEMLFDACEAMDTGSVYSFQFNEAGEWRFHDHINPRATGTVLVSE